MKKNTSLKLGLLVAGIALLPGCWSDGGGCCGHNHGDEDTGYSLSAPSKEDMSDTLVSMGPRRMITHDTLNEEFERLMEENPQVRQVVMLQPDFKTKFMTGMVDQMVMDEYVMQNGLDQSEEYKLELARLQRAVRGMLNRKHFGKQFTVAVDDAQVQAFYEENKDAMPDLLVSRGGVHASGIEFKKEADAKAFLAKAKGKEAKFTAVAKEAGLADKVDAFNVVNQQSVGLNPTLRNKITDMKKFPAVEMFKVDDSFWVVHATQKEAPKYRPLDQVKEPLRQFVEREEGVKRIQQEIDSLKKDYQIVINEAKLQPDTSMNVAALRAMADNNQGAEQEEPAAPVNQAARAA